MENNTIHKFACVSISNDSDIELLHSALDLSFTDSIANNSTEPLQIPVADGVFLYLQFPFLLTLVFVSTVIDGNLTCRSRESGKEQSVYIGGA